VEPLKHLLGAEAVEAIGRQLQRAWPAFDRPGFEAQALAGLDALPLKARAEHLADALQARLPARFDDCAAVLDTAMAGDDGLRGWALWPVGSVVSRHGLDHPERALRTLHRLTQGFTAEWAIRPFVLRHPELVFGTLARWASDPNEHVRRLVSEGTRPRLPWGERLQPLVQDPSPSLPLLRTLQDDASEYVRRSVANHLNDIAKDHPARLVDWLRQHLPGASEHRRVLLRHASRSLIKQGHPEVLDLWGVGAAWAGQARLDVAPHTLSLGGSLAITVTLVASREAGPQRVLLDYAMHFRKADGRLAPKVFKGWQRELQPGERCVLARQHPIKPISTRRYYAGEQGLVLLINGQAEAQTRFTLQMP
jgi:3-methyladenine DNA glycosylase AlkC